MERRQMIRIGMRITEAIIEILKEELGDKKKEKVSNAKKHKTVGRRSA